MVIAVIQLSSHVVVKEVERVVLILYGEGGAVRSFHQPQRLSNSMQVVAHVLIDWVNLNL